MATPTQYYVDPALSSDTGSGTKALPWGRASGSVVQYALTTGITRDATNGDQINIRSDQAVGTTTTTDDVLSSSLDILTNYGTPTTSAPLILRGYRTDENDGGIGGITGNGSVGILNNIASIGCIDLHLHNTGASNVIRCGSYSLVANCEIDTTTARAIQGGTTCTYLNNNIHDYGTYGISSIGYYSQAIGNYFSDASSTACIDMAPNSVALRNVCSIAGATIGIDIGGYGVLVANNSILSASGTGKGIVRTGDMYMGVVQNNLVEGFSGSGGVGIDLGIYNTNVGAYSNNAVYNCATKYSIASSDFILNDGDNEELTGTPFAKSGSETFANRFTYFAPTLNADNGGTVRGGAYPSGCRLDKGAVQHADPSSTTQYLPINRSNSLIGR